MSHFTKENKRKKEINRTQNLNYTIRGENILPDLRVCSKPWGREQIQYKCRTTIFHLLQKALSFPTWHKCHFPNRNCPIQLHIFFCKPFKFYLKTTLFYWPDYLFGRPFQYLTSQKISKFLHISRLRNQYISMWWHANITL